MHRAHRNSLIRLAVFALAIVGALACLGLVPCLAGPGPGTIGAGTCEGCEELRLPDDPAIESACNARQQQKCTDACSNIRKLAFACDVQFDWQPDGTCVRTVVCTCASANQITAKRIAEWQQGALPPFTQDDYLVLDDPCEIDLECPSVP